ncbi:MAG: tRNA(Met) cytidine acetyltransferase [Thermoprotei archaeon]|nr:MAG: tRNA(Met) cytidine acetyltransferase [Thermoprotei archaeon]
MKSIVLSRVDLAKLVRELKTAKQARHRRLLALIGDEDSGLVMGALEVADIYYRKFGGPETKLLYTYHAFYEDGVARRDMFKAGLKANYEAEYISYHELDKVLGRTYDIAIIDLINNLEPNDLGKLMGIVRGGGLYVLLMPRLETYLKIMTRFQSTLLTPQYKPEDLRKIFVRRFFKKLMEHDGIAVYDVDEKVFIRSFSRREEVKIREEEALSYPEKVNLPLQIYKLAITQDQINVLTLIEDFYEKPERKKVLVLTADRGRGKSSVVGLGLGGLAHKIRKAKGRCRILVTAPSESNVQELMKFAKKALEKLGHRVETKEVEGQIISLSSKGIDVEYYPPLSCLRRSGDILAVDEAAALHVPMLFALLRKFDRVIYSSTIHGYEGAGRGFSVRFLRRLRELKDIDIKEYEMERPIRYSTNDPIERWAFDLLLLDAEPATLDERDYEMIEKGEVEYFIPDLEEFFLKDEKLVREFIGIYIMAHYRNNPNDLGMMMDAPHHFIRALRLKSGKIVVSLELAEEGPLEDKLARDSAKGAWILGNIIPDRLIKHYKLIGFGKFKGIRIVRIATHPSVMSRGLGSKALEMVEKEAKENGYDWIGAGFGVTRELLNFWVKNGYIPVHISPERNPVSGEYSVIVVKPLSSRVKEYIDVFSSEFKRKLLGSMPEPYHDLNPRTAKMLLYSIGPINCDLPLTKYQLARFMSYAWGDMTVENCMDVMVELAKMHFMNLRCKLSEIQELLLITKVLQGKSWKVTCEELDITPPVAMDELRKAARKLSDSYLGISSEEEAEPLFYLML